MLQRSVPRLQDLASLIGRRGVNGRASQCVTLHMDAEVIVNCSSIAITSPLKSKGPSLHDILRSNAYDKSCCVMSTSHHQPFWAIRPPRPLRPRHHPPWHRPPLPPPHPHHRHRRLLPVPAPSSASTSPCASPPASAPAWQCHAP